MAKVKSLLDLPAVAEYLARIGAEPRSLRTAVVREQHGAYWTDKAVIKFTVEGAVDAPKMFAPTESEAARILVDVLGADWPRHKLLGATFEMPEELRGVQEKDLFEFRDLEGRLIMLQHRALRKGERVYRPWTFWDDGVWRAAEPDGKLPLWGLDKLGDHTTVFVHEGAKAARFVQKLINPATAEEREALDCHPWGVELSAAAHLGWIGGALSPGRTDWSALAAAGVKRVYIVADNDAPGRAAVPAIAQRLKGMTVFSVEFSEQWPTSFDLADEFPKKMFAKLGKHRNYVGPAFRACLHPATWATDQMPNPEGKGRPITVLRKEFRELWHWVEESDLYVCKEMPEITRPANLFNGLVAAFSHTNNTALLVQKTYKGRTTRLTYRPDIEGRVVSDRTTSAINLHTPTTVKPVVGSFAPWLEYMEYMFPDEEERHEMMRWCATLIARTDIRMLYSVLLVSETQGMGKSTLGEKILAPLVGMQNTGFPTERDIVESSFNGWVANKRLIVVGEIYTGQSWKAYNQLKGYITDKMLEVNEKFMRPYKIENWSHIFACSNSKKALRMEESDRRWYYPTVGERPWSREKFGEFLDWLGAGGLGIILTWAQQWTDYVKPGEHAPMTDAKSVMIRDSLSDAMRNWIDIMEAVEADEEVVAFALGDVREYLGKASKSVHESLLDLRKAARKRGWGDFEQRITYAGASQNVVLSPMLEAQRSSWEGAEAARSAVRSKIKGLLARRDDLSM